MNDINHKSNTNNYHNNVTTPITIIVKHEYDKAKDEHHPEHLPPLHSLLTWQWIISTARGKELNAVAS